MEDLDSDLPRLPPMRLDLTPLVDVIFLLLIFFMVSTTFKEDRGIELELPEATSSAKSELNDLRVRLDEAGVVYFKESAIELTALEATARQALAAVDQRMFVVEADARANHGKVVEVMDALRRAGAEGLTIATAGAAGGAAAP